MRKSGGQGYLTRGVMIRIGVLILALVLPFLPLVTDYVLHIVILIFLYMILALGLNIVPGFCGLLDLGFVGFYGIGAYTSGLLTVHLAKAPEARPRQITVKAQ